MLFRFFKRIDKAEKIFLPKVAMEKFGKEYYLEIYEDKMILIPIKKGN